MMSGKDTLPGAAGYSKKVDSYTEALIKKGAIHWLLLLSAGVIPSSGSAGPASLGQCLFLNVVTFFFSCL